MIPSRDISRLIEIMAALRDPVAGCPWDIVQTHETIVPYTIEETYEVVDAIERKDMPDLRDELGDLLLQVVYHAQLAAERDDFAFGDVVQSITEKMIRRHPHVFGDTRARDAGAAKGQWDRIKAEEKAKRREERERLGLPEEGRGYLDGISNAMPSFAEAAKLQAKAAKVGFDWDRSDHVIEKIDEELEEVRDALGTGDQDALEGELGDLLFAVINLARHSSVDPEQAVRRTNAKFRKRFAAIEDGLAKQGTALADASLEQMEALWVAAKRSEGQSNGS